MDGRYHVSASRMTIVAHLFGITALILLIAWLLHYQGGLDYESNNPYRVFNVHPFLMFFGLIFIVGEAMMTYKIIPAEHNVQKFIHMVLQLIGIILGIIGLCAVFKFHDMINVSDVYSLHSWLGITAICLFCLQWVFGFFAFVAPKASNPTRMKFMAMHMCVGRALLYMAICAALTGLMEKATFLQLGPHQPEFRLINFTGLAILLFGIFVDLSVTLAHYVY